MWWEYIKPTNIIDFVTQRDTKYPESFYMVKIFKPYFFHYQLLTFTPNKPLNKLINTQCKSLTILNIDIYNYKTHRRKSVYRKTLSPSLS